MSKTRKSSSRKRSAPPSPGWSSHDLLRWGAQASAVAALVYILTLVFPIARDVANSDPPPLIGRRSLDPLAKTVESIQIEQSKFIGTLSAFSMGQLQADCRSLADRKDGLELRRQMSGNDRLVRDTLAQVNKNIAETRRALEAGGQIPEC